MADQLTLYEDGGTLYAGSIGETTPVSWRGDDGLSFEEWEAIGRTLQQVGASLNWWVGDWLNYGERKWGEMYAQAIEVTGWEYQRLANAKYVCSRIDFSSREEKLTWTHHKEVADLPPDKQSRWLQRAVDECMSTRELRDAIRASQQPSQTAYHPLPADLHEMQHRSANGHTLPDDEGDDVPFSFGRNGSSYEGERDGDANRFLDTSVLVHNGMGNYYELSHGTKQCAKCKQLWAADLDYCPYCHISPEARRDYVQREVERNSKPHVANNSGNNEWYTPEQFTQAARDVMGEITLDPASSELANTKVRAAHIYTADDDGLSKPWFGKVWLNPPYAAGLVDKFASKLVVEYESGEVSEAIVLVNNATETGWFASLVSIASVVCFPFQRIKYWTAAGELNTPLQGQAILYVGTNAGEFVARFSLVGWCAWVA